MHRYTHLYSFLVANKRQRKAQFHGTLATLKDVQITALKYFLFLASKFGDNNITPVQVLCVISESNIPYAVELI